MKKDDIKVFSVSVGNRICFGVAPSLDRVKEWINDLSDFLYTQLFSTPNRNYTIKEIDIIIYVFNYNCDSVELWLGSCEIPCSFHLDRKLYKKEDKK